MRGLNGKIPGYKKERCAKCRYRGTAGNDVICEYYLITGQRRRGDGENCEEFAEGSKIKIKDEMSLTYHQY